MAESEPITQEEFRRLCDYLYRRTGLVFTEARRYFVERRVTDRMAETGMTSFTNYFARLRGVWTARSRDLSMLSPSTRPISTAKIISSPA